MGQIKVESSSNKCPGGKDKKHVSRGKDLWRELVGRGKGRVGWSGMRNMVSHEGGQCVGETYDDICCLEVVEVFIGK